MSTPTYQELIDPKYDYVFKHIFGNTEHPRTCLDLVNAIFESCDQPPIEELTVLNPAIDKDALTDKSSVLDLKARTSTGEYINIEMQLWLQKSWIQRVLYYWSKLYEGQLSERDEYKKLKRTVTISLLNFTIFDRPSPVSLYELKERRDNKVLTDLMQLYFLEFPKRDAIACLPGRLQNWVSFFTATTEAELDQISGQNEAIVEATKMLKYISQDPRERERFEARRKMLMDEKDRLEGAWEQGEKSGILKGEVKGVKKTAIRMLKAGSTIKFVHEMTGLPEEVILELKSQLSQ